MKKAKPGTCRVCSGPTSEPRSRRCLSCWYASLRLTVEARFWSKVNPKAPNGCWEWTGAKSGRHGYGAFHRGSRYEPQDRAHRVAWELTHGPIPAGLGVLHHCDNPPCVNPAHLFLGTQADNVADMVAKGRGVNNPPRGEASPQARLTEAQVREIREWVANGRTMAATGAAFGVNQSSVWAIVHRRNWGWLDAEEVAA